MFVIEARWLSSQRKLWESYGPKDSYKQLWEGYRPKDSYEKVMEKLLKKLWDSFFK